MRGPGGLILEPPAGHCGLAFERRVSLPGSFWSEIWIAGVVVITALEWSLCDAEAKVMELGGELGA